MTLKRLVTLADSISYTRRVCAESGTEAYWQCRSALQLLTA
jgi:hypothetical protein